MSFRHSRPNRLCGFHHWFCFGRPVLAAVIALSSAALSARLDQDGFIQLLDEIHRQNQIDVSAVPGIADEAVEYVSLNSSVENRILLAAALAPIDSLHAGYRDARMKLISFLGESESIGKSGTLKPLLRYALSDLAYRHGEYRFSYLQLIDALRSVDLHTPEPVRDRILSLAVQINIAANLSQFALMNLDQWRHSGNADDLHSLLLEAEIHWLDLQFDVAEQLLELTSQNFKETTEPSIISAFWIQRAWLAIGESAYLQAEDFLGSAISSYEEKAPHPLRAEVSLLQGLILLKESPEGVEQARNKFREARNLFTAAALPARYPELLLKAIYIYESIRYSHVPELLLDEISQFTYDETNLRAYARGLAALSELNSRNGMSNPLLSNERHRKSYRYAIHFVEKMGELHMEWLLQQSLSLNHGKLPPQSLVFYYTLIFLLILVIVLLVLVLRIRGQRHLNRQLAEAVKKARIAEEAAEESNRLKTQFLANISHEIKTPMSGLVGMASLLDELVTDPTQRKYLGTIRICSQNLLVLVNDLLDLGRMDSGTFEIENHSFEIRETLNYCLDLVRKNAEKKQINLSLVVEDRVPQRVKGDSTRIGQIITNLLTNAIKFTDQGDITLHANFEKTLGNCGNLNLRVDDTGIGIASNKLHTVFEPFSQERTGPDHKREGSGLGLAITQKLVELMGGSIAVASEVGKGSSFRVIIPVKL